jgi:hypothetical protein
VRASADHQLADHLLQEISIFQAAVRRLQAFGKILMSVPVLVIYVNSFYILYLEKAEL